MIENYVAITDHVVTLDSEADMEFFLNNVDLTGIIWSVVAKGGQFTFVAIEGGPVVPPEVAAVLARYSALTQQETDAITKFVSNELQAIGNNWTKRDEVFAWALNATDWLIGMKAVTSINTGGVRTDEGVTLNGVDQHMNPNTPLSGLTQYQLNNARVALYMSAMAGHTGNKEFAGVFEGGNLMEIRDATAVLAFMGINSNNGSNLNINRIPSSLVVSRGSAANWIGYQNGVASAQQTRPSTSVPTISPYVGARNNGGLTDRRNQITAALFSVGAGVGMDEAAAYTNELELLIDLGVFINPVLARYTGLTQQEIDALTVFVHTEVRQGWWLNTDDYFCLALSGANALIGMKQFTATLSGDAALVAGQGVQTNPTAESYVDLQFNPSTNGAAWRLNDAGFGFYASDIDFPLAGTRYYMGAGITALSASILTKIGSDRFNGAVNISNGWQIYNQARPLSNGFFAHQRSGNQMEAKNTGAPVQANTRATSGNSLSNANMLVGASSGGSAGNRVVPALYHMAYVGGVVDLAQRETNMQELLIGLGAFVNPVLASYSNLTAGEITAITNFVNASVRSGNWFAYGEVYVPCLNNTGSDWLTGMRGSVAQAFNATRSGQGAVFNGTDAYFNLSLAPNNAPSWTLLNAGMTVVTVTDNANAATATVMGVRDGSDFESSIEAFGTSQLAGRINALNSNRIDFGAARAAGVYLMQRIPASTMVAFKDGAQTNSRGIGAQGVNTENMFLGARNNAGSQERFWNGTCPFASMGGAVPNPVAQNTEIRNLLTDLGVTIP